MAARVAGMADDTVFLVVSDHGDMQMEHQQYYKPVHQKFANIRANHMPL